MTDDSNVIPLRDPQPDDDTYPLPWRADEAGRIHDARGRQIGALVSADLAQLAVRVLNAAVALNQAETDQST